MEILAVNLIVIHLVLNTAFLTEGSMQPERIFEWKMDR